MEVNKWFENPSRQLTLFVRIYQKATQRFATEVGKVFDNAAVPLGMLHY